MQAPEQTGNTNGKNKGNRRLLLRSLVPLIPVPEQTNVTPVVAEQVTTPSILDITKSDQRFSRAEALRMVGAYGLVALVGTGSVPFITPQRSPKSPERSRYQVYSGWLEDNMPKTSHLLDISGLGNYLVDITSANPFLIEASKAYMKELVNRAYKPDRFLLGESYQTIFDIVKKQFAALPSGVFDPAVNIRREIVHATQIAKARAEYTGQDASSLKQLAVDLSRHANYKRPGIDFFYNRDIGVATNAFPITFGHTPNQSSARTRGEWEKSFKGTDNQHISHNGALTDIRHYDLEQKTTNAPIVNVLALATQGNNNLESAQNLSVVAGMAHEIIGSLPPSQWPLEINRPNEGLFEIGRGKESDLKRNHLGRLISAELIRLSLLIKDNAKFDEAVSALFSNLNDLRYQHIDTPAVLVLPPMFPGLVLSEFTK